MEKNTSNSNKYPKTAVSVFAYNDKGEILLMKGKEAGGYMPPEVLIEEEETAADAAARALENADLKVENLKFVGYREKTAAAHGHAVLLVFLGSAADSRKAGIGKRSEIKWKKPEEWLESKLEEATREMVANLVIPGIQDYESKYRRALADYQNLLKRTAAEKQDFAKYANENILRDFLPVYENLKTSLEHFKGDAEKDSWAQGIKYVAKQFKDLLGAYGVEEIETTGKDFDPNLMEALEGKGKAVAKQVRPGYTLNGKVIVPAKVILGEADQPE